MKNILMALMMLILLVFTGCDNNSGPFTMEYRNGELIVLSDGKPAKGDIKYYYDVNGVSITAYEAHYDNGLIDGTCKIYNNKNKVVFEGEFNRKDSSTYDVNIKLFNGTIKGTIRITSEELQELFDEPVSRGFGDNVNLNDWFDKRAIDATISTDKYKAIKKNGIFDEKRETSDWYQVYKDGVIVEESVTKYDGVTEKTYYKTDKIREVFNYDKNNILISYRYIDYTYSKFGREVREEYSTNYYFKYVTPEDKGSISYEGVDEDIFVYIILGGELAPAITVSREGNYKLERWALPRGLNINQEHLKSLYYEVIGSNLAKYPGELKKILAMPNKEIDKYGSEIFTSEHYQNKDYPRIDR
jgi:MORN variant repeat protein